MNVRVMPAKGHDDLEHVRSRRTQQNASPPMDEACNCSHSCKHFPQDKMFAAAALQNLTGSPSVTNNIRCGGSQAGWLHRSSAAERAV